MKVLLVQSYLRDKSEPVYPIGLAYIASSLTGHEVRILDLNIAKDPYAELNAVMASFKPDVAGISLRNIDNQKRIELYYYYKDFELLLKNINTANPDTIIVVGGAGFSMFAEEIMKQNPAINYGIYLEGEDVFPELLKNIKEPESVKGIFVRKHGKVAFTGQRALPDFRRLPPPRRDMIDITPYLANQSGIGIQTKRGCILKCAYCNYPVLNGSVMRLREPAGIVDEIAELVNRYGVKHFIFADSVFNLPQKHAKAICEEILKRNIKVEWTAWLDIRYVDKGFLLLAAKAGCKSVAFSPDAISNSALKALKKGISEDDIWKTVALFTETEELKKLNVSFGSFINPPGETLAGLLKTIFFYFRVKLALKRRGGASLNWIRIEPDTEVYNIALKEGLLDKNTALLPNNEKGLKNLFYSRSTLSISDPVIIGFFKAIELLKKAVRKG
ncbi:radical SAM protein [bacterium]|nr:MAG: radical SAM protein [bacterium]